MTRITGRAPQAESEGAPRLTGREAADTVWAMYQEAFPDNRLETIAIHADDRGGVHEGRATGTHTGTLHGPAGKIPPTGKMAQMPFCGVYQFEEGKVASYHLYFDQADFLSQPGITPGG